MDDFDEIMAREIARIESLKAKQSALQDQIHSTEAYMNWLVARHVQSTLPEGACSVR